MHVFFQQEEYQFPEPTSGVFQQGAATKGAPSAPGPLIPRSAQWMATLFDTVKQCTQWT